jgi:hypothetical protein
MVRKRNIGNRWDQSGSSRNPRRAIMFPENRRGMIKEKRIRTRSREVRGGY